jgi:hypothetical protein
MNHEEIVPEAKVVLQECPTQQQVKTVVEVPAPLNQEEIAPEAKFVLQECFTQRQVTMLPEVSVLSPVLNKMHEGARPPEEAPECFPESPAVALLPPEFVVFKPELIKMHEGARPPEEVLQPTVLQPKVLLPHVAEQFFIGDAKLPKVSKKQKKALRAVAARAAPVPSHVWPAGLRVALGCSIVLLLFGFLQLWWSLDGVGTDSVEEVFEHFDVDLDYVEEVFTSEGGEHSCWCGFEVGFTHSQVFANDGGDFEHGEFGFVSNVDGCHAHCVGVGTDRLAAELEAQEVDDICEEQ